MGDTNRRGGIPTEIVVAAVVLTAAIPLRRLFLPGRLAGIVLLSTLLALVTSWATRRLRFPPVLAWFASMMCLLWWVSALFFRESLWGPFPSAETFDQISLAIRQGAKQVVEEAAPVAPTDPKMMFIAAGVWVTTWLVEAAALWVRNALLAILCAVPLFVVPGAIEPSKHRVLELGLFATAIAWMLFVDQARRVKRLTPRRPDDARTGWRAAPSLKLIVAAVLATVVAAPYLPGYGDPPGFAGSGGTAATGRIAINPLVAIKPTLDNPRVRTLFRVRVRRPGYYRLTSLEVFTGKAWIPGRRTREETPLSRQAVSGPTTRLEQVYTMDALAGDWLPALYDPVAIAAPATVSLETETRALIVPRGIGFGASYSVVSEVPSPTQALLDRPVTYDEGELGPYLDLPRIPKAIVDIARRETKGAKTPFAKALALQEFLREFTYDQNVAAGHSFDTLEEFLTESKRGYCEQFAGSMAVLARALGIPSRVAIGFARGTGIADGVYEVTTEHAHAWVEVFFPQSGWVIFEPTPRGQITSPPAYARPETGSTDEPEQEAEPSATPSPNAGTASRDPEAEAADFENESAASAWPSRLIGAAIAILLLALLSIGVRVVPRLRRGRVRSPSEAVGARYADLLAWCASVGFPRRPGQTPQEHSSILASAAPAGAASAEQVALLVEEALWAPPNGLDPASFDEAAEQVRAALIATVPRHRRVLVTLGWGRWRSST